MFIFCASVLTVSAQTPKNIIFMIGDGMGLAQLYAAMTANGGQLNIEQCTYTGFSKTYSANHYITDSAAGGTALACGVKTKNGMIGMSPDTVAVPSLVVFAAEKKKSTGVVAVCSVTHATPASFVAHQDNRNKDEAIASDFLKSPIDVFIGGGLKFFQDRSDKCDLTKELKKKGYLVALNMEEVKKAESGKLAGLLAYEHPETALERGNMLKEASLTAINLLNQNKNGFFLMIEGSQIDWAGHDNSESRTISETLDFDATIGAVLDFAKNDGNTLVVITADHETGGLTIMNGDLKKRDVELKFNKTDHTGLMVPVYAYGPGAEKFTGIQENIEIPMKMKKMWSE
ncbi:MAG: alkaline phosphatase [Prevotellaceae bacterium]|nr:alkaline phosphatase [Prevotellaceae bacterium]